MKHRVLYLAGALALTITALLISGCAKESPLSTEGDGLAAIDAGALSIVDVNGSATTCVALIAGRTMNAGSVCFDDVDTDGDLAVDALRITITTSGWTLSDVKVWAGTSLTDAPVNKSGNPVPGKFPYTSGGLEGTSAAIDIPFSVIGVTCEQMAPIYVATHATVRNGTTTETAWGEGARFVAKGNWAMYSTVVVSCDQIEEPPDDVCETAYAFGGPAPACFFDVEDEDGNLLFNEWGWTNAVEPGTSTFAVLAQGDGGGFCDVAGAVNAGTMTVVNEGGFVTVTFVAESGFGIDEAYLYVGDPPFPLVDGTFSIDPAAFTVNATGLNKAPTWTTTVPAGSNLIFRAKVCGPF